MAKGALTPKQALFVEEYLVDLNATQAALRAGYRTKYARQVGAENLTKPVIADAIAKAQAARSEATGVTAKRVLEEYALLAFSDLGAILDFTGTEPRLKPGNAISEGARKAIASIKVRRYTEGHGDDAKEVEV